MKTPDLKTNSRAELETMLQNARMQISQMRFDLADKKLKKTSDIAATRRLIARILTVMKSSK